MFKKNTMKAIAIALTLAVVLNATGITHAAITPTQADIPAPITPLTDSEMEQIEGGAWVLAAIGILISVVALTCQIIDMVSATKEPVVEEYYSITSGDNCINVQNLTIYNYGTSAPNTCPSQLTPVTDQTGSAGDPCNCD